MDLPDFWRCLRRATVCACVVLCVGGVLLVGAAAIGDVDHHSRTGRPIASPPPAALSRQLAACAREQLCVAQQELKKDVRKLRKQNAEKEAIDTLLSPIIVVAVALRITAIVLETSARNAPGWGSFVTLLGLDFTARLVVIALAVGELIVLVKNSFRGTIEFNGLLAATVFDSAIMASSCLRLIACVSCLHACHKCTLLNCSTTGEGAPVEWKLWDMPFNSDPISIGYHDQAEHSIRQHEVVNAVARHVLQQTEYVWGPLALVPLLGCVLDATVAKIVPPSVLRAVSRRSFQFLLFLLRTFLPHSSSSYMNRWLDGVERRSSRMVLAGVWMGYLRREVHHRCILALALHGHFEDHHVVALDEKLSREGLPGTPLFVAHGQDWRSACNVRSGEYYPHLAPTMGVSISILVDRSLSAEAFCRQLLGVVDERMRVVSRVLDDGFFLDSDQAGLVNMLDIVFRGVVANAPLASLVLNPSRNASSVARVALFANTLRGLLLDPLRDEDAVARAKDEVSGAEDVNSRDSSCVRCLCEWFSSSCRCFLHRQQAKGVLGETSIELAVELFYGLKVLATRDKHDAAVIQKGYWWSRASLLNVSLPPQAELINGQKYTSQDTVIIDDMRDGEESHDLQPNRPISPVGDGPSFPVIGESQQDRQAPATTRKPGTLPPAWRDVHAALEHFSEMGLLPWMVASDLGIEELDGMYVAMGRQQSRSPSRLAYNAGADNRMKKVLLDIHDATSQLRLKLAEPLADHTTANSWCLEQGAALYPAQPARLGQTLQDRSGGHSSDVPDEIAAVFDTSHLEQMTLAEMQGRWHAKWKEVLRAACVRDDVPTEPVLRLPFVGFYPSMRLALDAHAGIWEPVEAAVLSATASIVRRRDRPAASQQRFETLRTEMEKRKRAWPMRRVHAVSTFATILLSSSTTEAALYRGLLHVSDEEDRQARGTSVVQEMAVGVRNAFASVALTGRLVAQPVCEGAAAHTATPDDSSGDTLCLHLSHIPERNGSGDAARNSLHEWPPHATAVRPTGIERDGE